jgi:hypothetical protein
MKYRTKRWVICDTKMPEGIPITRDKTITTIVSIQIVDIILRRLMPRVESVMNSALLCLIIKRLAYNNRNANVIDTRRLILELLR